MNKIVLPLLLVALSVAPSCKKVEKNAHNYYPVVKTDSVVSGQDGTATVYGEVLSGDSYPVTMCGFCMDEQANPDMLTNQVISTTRDGNKFSYKYSHFNASKRYYFRAWAVNKNGYGIGGDVSDSNIAFSAATIPCSPSPGYMYLDGNGLSIYAEDVYNNVYSMTTSGTTYVIEADGDAHHLTMAFSKFPYSGVYTVIDGVEPTEENTVTLAVDYLYTSYVGAKVYVQQINSYTIDVTVCSANVEASVGFSNYPFFLTTKFRCPS